MTTIVFVIPGTARGKQRPRATRTGRVYTPAQTVNQEAYIKMLAATAMRGLAPFGGPLEATFAINVAIPKSFTKQQREKIAEGKLFPTSKPDIDNVVKLLCDAMNGVVYGDDKQIVDLFVNKMYADHAQTTVMVTMKGTDNGHDRPERSGSMDAGSHGTSDD
jgi:Holliday junction resolvase RusA-like endonuclease